MMPLSKLLKKKELTLNKTLLIDASFLGHRSRFTLGNLSTEERRTGVIFGFLDQIWTIGMEFQTNNFIFCWDSRESIRKEMSPIYKNKRHEDLTPEEIYELKIAFEQFDILRTEVLPEMGFKNHFQQEGYEADDIFASYVHRNKDCIIVSADQDLFQLLDYADMYNNQTKKLITSKSFQKLYGCTPKQWIQVKAIAGCKSDNVAGIEGVGEKSVIKYLNGELPKLTKKKEPNKSFALIEEFKEEKLKENIPLVKLPLRGTKVFKKVPNDFSMERFIRICFKYEFISFIKEQEQWRRFFALGENNGKQESAKGKSKSKKVTKKSSRTYL